MTGLLSPSRPGAGAAMPIASLGAAAEKARVTFVLSSDLYRMSDQGWRGGLARLAAMVEAEKARGGTEGKLMAGDVMAGERIVIR